MTAFIDTKPGYRVFCEVAAQRGPRLSGLARSCGLPRSLTRQILDEQILAKEVCEVDKRFYLDDGGITFIARHNQNRHQTVRKSITLAPAPDEAHSAIQEKHDGAVNKVLRRFRNKGFDVWDGRRMGIGAVEDPKPWFPDLWVNIHAVRDQFILHAVRVDPSTRCETRAKEIIREYRRAASSDPVRRPLLLIARDAAVADLFGRAGDDLDMMVTHLREFFDGDHPDHRTQWLYHGKVWGIYDLARMIWLTDEVTNEAMNEFKMGNL